MVVAGSWRPSAKLLIIILQASVLGQMLNVDAVLQFEKGNS